MISTGQVLYPSVCVRCGHFPSVPRSCTVELEAILKNNFLPLQPALKSLGICHDHHLLVFSRLSEVNRNSLLAGLSDDRTSFIGKIILRRLMDYPLRTSLQHERQQPNLPIFTANITGNGFAAGAQTNTGAGQSCPNSVIISSLLVMQSHVVRR